MKRTPRLPVCLLALVSACGGAGADDFDLKDGARYQRGDEGEGDEGEGDEGEGDGVVVGEGEGDGVVVGEGEGDGVVVGDGEGEGEGDPPSSCPPGFVVDGARCIPIGPVELTRRSEREVCDRWNRDYVWTEEWQPTPGSSDQCDLGVVPQAALDNGMTRVNLYRWLAGVDPAQLEPSLFEQEQACATLMAAHGGLTHQPSPDMPCYSGAAAAGAGSSNIAGGGGIAGSVDMYISDFGGFNASALGHRRWTIGPFMNVTQFGVRNNYSCMYSFGVGGGRDPGFVAWPPPGIVPTATAAGDFHFESIQYSPSVDTTVEVAVDDGAFAPVEFRFLDGNYGHYGTAIAWAPPLDLFATWQDGRVVRVRLHNTRGGDIEYTVKFKGC